MAYALCLGQCVACSNPVWFNPRRVPSLTINGVKRELCLPCALRWCHIHGKNPAEVIMPDAYEPINETDL